MAGIYQEIWNADQACNGIEPLWNSEAGSADSGYVKINERFDDNSGSDLQLFTEVVIPDSKMRTYNLVRKLFNNYALAEPMAEVDTPEERQEVHDFVSAIIETDPMEVAREYIARETGTDLSKERWYNTIVEMWFRRFSMGGDPELCGFEHIVVGEQEKSKVQGYHFWWKYFLDDGFARTMDGEAGFPALTDDRIRYHSSKQKQGQVAFPESLTISFKWDAPDYDAQETRPLFKKIGGFFVGCSVEGLIALGTIRAHKGIRAPQVAVIEGARYDMKLYHSPNNQHIRTFYPIFLGPADAVDGGGRSEGGNVDVPIPDFPESPDVVASPVRIIGAMVNPKGDDVGFETVTLVNAGPDSVSINNWIIEDKNGKNLLFEDRIVEAGEFFRVRLSGDDVQLSNKGGTIILKDAQGSIVHKVSYSKSQAKNKGATVLF